MSDWEITRPYGRGYEFWMLRKRLFWWEWRAATGENISTVGYRSGRGRALTRQVALDRAHAVTRRT